MANTLSLCKPFSHHDFNMSPLCILEGAMEGELTRFEKEDKDSTNDQSHSSLKHNACDR